MYVLPLPQKTTDKILSRVAVSPNGWTDQELGFLLLRDVFDPQTAAINTTRATRLLVLNGHNSHCSIEFLNLAKSKNIEILCLPPHTTHALQPCDVGVFSPLASHWAAEVEKAFDSGEGVSRQTFLKVYHRARDQAITPQTIQAAWRKAGIHPLNYNELPASAYLPATNTSINSTLPNLSLVHPMPTAPSAFLPPPRSTPSTGISTPTYQDSLDIGSDMSSIITQSSCGTARGPSPSVADTVTTLEISPPDNTPPSIAPSVISTSFSASYSAPIDTHTARLVHPAVSRSAIPTQPSCQATQEELHRHIECLDILVNRMACQIEADAAIQTLFLHHKQKLMEQLKRQLTHKPSRESLHTSACHMTSEGGLQHAGFQSQKKHFKQVWPQLKKVARARTTAATKAAKAAAEKENIAARPVHEIKPGRKTQGVRKPTAKRGVGPQVRRTRRLESDVESSSDGSFVPKTPPMTRRKLHTQQAAQARSHISMESIPGDSTLESNIALVPIAPRLQVGQPPFTTDDVATPTSSQAVSSQSGGHNLKIGTQQTQHAHLNKPPGLTHEDLGTQRVLRPRPAT